MGISNHPARSKKPEDEHLTDEELRAKYGGWLNDPFSNDDVTDEMKALAKILGYRKLPPKISTYLMDNDYLGLKETGMSGKALYPAWMPVLEDIFPTRLHIGHPIVTLSCALGCGKSTVSTIMMSYVECRINHLDNQDFIRGMTGKEMVMGLVHTKMEKTISDFKEPLATIKEQSPYWKSGMVSHNILDYKIGGERNIKSILGGDLICAVLSEVNFWDNYARAKGAIESLIGRVTGRFGHVRKYFTLIVLDSSPSESGVSVVNDFLSTNPDIYNVEMSEWKAKEHLPGRYFVEGEFYVYCGDQMNDPFVFPDSFKPENLDPKFDKDKVIRVPEELRVPFMNNTAKALRDHAGVTHELGGGYFFKDKSKLSTVFNLPHLNKDVIEVDFYDNEDRIYSQLDTSLSRIPKNKVVYVGLDLATSNDLAGIAIGYFDDYIYPFPNNPKMKEPTFIINTVCGIGRKPGQETSLAKIKDLIMELNKNYEIGGVSCDQFQSKLLMQELEHLKIPTKYISLDRTDVGYNNLKNTIYTNRIKLPSCKWLKNELTYLQYIDGKIDHISNANSGGSTVAGGGKFSKDLADAVASCLLNMSEDLEHAASLSLKSSMGRQIDMLQGLYMKDSVQEDKARAAQVSIMQNIF